ncbi:nuclear transport factor 2 family protein [Pluralibacter gergoviae]|uniref:nuclear transport factor 2 family protein n=1 Tax=Pluralibacter gergoviae TaxID=61647 RepID=UPI00155EB28D|nr:nuclear transport factor 2 family protein [Pluralibacter gergoviae]
MNRTEDKVAIGELINGWIYRDTGQWDKLAAIFAPDATIEVTWFEGKASEFIAASRKMGASAISSKHFIGAPVITFSADGSRAVTETNAMIIAMNESIRLGATVHNRFLDSLQKVNGEWKICQRQVVYDCGSFDFPAGIVDIDPHVVGQFPLAYAPLGYLLHSGGYAVQRLFATRNSPLEADIRRSNAAWLES